MPINAKLGPKQVGERTQGIILARFMAYEYTILIPFGDSTRYDLVIEKGGEFWRIQCKTGRINRQRDGLEFNTSSMDARTWVRRHYRGEIDYFAVYCEETDGVYLVPIAEIPGNTQATLRFDPPRNNQKKGVRMAADYEI
jgi:PD-(D/E)XK endonuclease